jgi:hypothetical protein
MRASHCCDLRSPFDLVSEARQLIDLLPDVRSECVEHARHSLAAGLPASDAIALRILDGAAVDRACLAAY